MELNFLDNEINQLLDTAHDELPPKHKQADAVAWVENYITKNNLEKQFLEEKRIFE